MRAMRERIATLSESRSCRFSKSDATQQARERDPVRGSQLPERAYSRIEYASLDLLEMRERDVVVLHDIHQRQAFSLPDVPAPLPEPLLEVRVGRHDTER